MKNKEHVGTDYTHILKQPDMRRVVRTMRYVSVGVIRTPCVVIGRRVFLNGANRECALVTVRCADGRTVTASADDVEPATPGAGPVDAVALG